jgi:hypothetical protein
MHLMTLGAVLLAAAATAPSAQAQSCAEPVPLVHSSYPGDGATGVPTNAPLYLYGSQLDVETSEVTLQGPTGQAESIDVQPVEGGLLVDAFLGLAANRRYELTVTGAGETWSTGFTTGTEPATRVQLSPPDVEVSVINQDRGACGVVSAICVSGAVSPGRTLEVLVGDEVMSLGDGEPVPVYAAGGANVAADECIQVRQREPGGAVSAALRFCASARSTFELAANAAAPRSCASYRGDSSGDDSEAASDSGGCMMGGAPGAASGAGGALAGLSVLLAARWSSGRRRRARAGCLPGSRARVFEASARRSGA